MLPEFPHIFRVRQKFDAPRIEDLDREVQSQLAGLDLAEVIRPAESVAITAGSRGIANIPRILKAIVDHMRHLGAEPFLVPSMGSHGGGTAEGQRHVLESYGVTEEFCGCPIRASMETVVLGVAQEGFPIHFDRFAYEADHVVVCGRVKPHTGFDGDIQSGLLKMLLIGLGKAMGASLYHRAIQRHGFPWIIRSVASEVLDKANIVAGLAIVENAEDQTARIEALLPSEFLRREPELLRLATQWMPRLPFPRADVLIVDEIGKDISGTGMDTNVVGRKGGESAEFSPEIERIIVRGLTRATHGNATGLGYADFCLSRLVEAIDQEATVFNCVTSCNVAAAKIPIHYPTDRQILDTALRSLGTAEGGEARILWIRNTLDVREVECSAAYLEEAASRDDLEILTPLRPLPFDGAGCLITVG